MYRICRLEVNKHSGKVIYSQCYEFHCRRVQSAKDKLCELSGMTAKEVLPFIKADSTVFKHFYNEFCDGHAAGVFWTMGNTEKGLITETVEYYSEWFVYTTDKQMYLYGQPVTDLKRYRAIENAREFGFNPYEKRGDICDDN